MVKACQWALGMPSAPKMASGFSEPDFRSHAKTDSIARQLGDTTEALSFFINKRDVSWIGMRATQAQQQVRRQQEQWKKKGCRFFDKQS